MEDKPKTNDQHAKMKSGIIEKKAGLNFMANKNISPQHLGRGEISNYFTG
jgi:hypothetical protein